MRSIWRRLSAVFAATVLLAALALPALAVVSKSGTHYCSYGYLPYSRSYSTGSTHHYPPGSGSATFENGGTWTVRKAHSNAGDDGGWWQVSTNGSLNDPGTYAGCTNIN